MLNAQIIYKGKAIAETQHLVPTTHNAALWAHRMGWNVICYDDAGGKLESDCGKRKATLRIYHG